MNKHNVLLAGALGAASTFAGCTEITPLGVSGEISAVRGEDSALAVPRYFTTISTPEGRRLAPNAPLGDVDGDGFDDLLIGAVGPDSQVPGQVADMKAYLFYGRAVLPEQLTFADADATFETGYMERMPLGDVNGDGLADFALGDGTGLEIVFGSPQRYSGNLPKFSAGIKWIYGDPPRENQATLRFFRAYPVGDVNGDGTGEFVLEANVPNATDLRRLNIEHYLVEGRATGWPSGAWDPSWAAARFAADDSSTNKPYPVGSGDIDGDGYSDVITRRDERFWLYYGGPRGLHGDVTESIADAELVTDGRTPYVLGDIDEDGADDLALASTGEIEIVYGSPARYSGVVTPEPDLIFTGSSGTILVGDFNADGLKDLIINAKVATEPDSLEPTPPPVAYELRGTGTRLTGRQVLQPAQLYRPVGYAAPEALSTGLDNAIGDIDGDGSTDISVVDWNESGPSAVYLLPGIAPTPD